MTQMKSLDMLKKTSSTVNPPKTSSVTSVPGRSRHNLTGGRGWERVGDGGRGWARVGEVGQGWGRVGEGGGGWGGGGMMQDAG